MARPDHKANIKRFLLTGRRVTPIIALARWRCFRLASVIFRLRREGLNIDSHIDPSGHYSVYYLKK